MLSFVQFPNYFVMMELGLSQKEKKVKMILVVDNDA